MREMGGRTTEAASILADATEALLGAILWTAASSLPVHSVLRFIPQ